MKNINALNTKDDEDYALGLPLGRCNVHLGCGKGRGIK